MELSLIIPAYNEEKVIAQTLEDAVQCLAALVGSFEILVVDDGSTDQTAQQVRQCKDTRVKLISYQPNRGKGYAVRMGILAARGNVVCYTDADLAYGLHVFGHMLDLLLDEGADVVIGSRKMDKAGYQNYPFLRLMASKCFSWISEFLSGLPYDTQCGIKGFRREAGQKIFSKCTTNGFAFDVEVLMMAERMGFDIVQMPVSIVNHQDSKVRVVRDSIRILRDMLAIRHKMNQKDKQEMRP